MNKTDAPSGVRPSDCATASFASAVESKWEDIVRRMTPESSGSTRDRKAWLRPEFVEIDCLYIQERAVLRGVPIPSPRDLYWRWYGGQRQHVRYVYEHLENHGKWGAPEHAAAWEELLSFYMMRYATKRKGPHWTADPWPSAPSHSDMVARALAFLEARGCSVVADGLYGKGAASSPDAVGWIDGQRPVCIMVEAKASKSDFMSDTSKRSHLEGRLVGDRRWYIVPPGIVEPSDLPAGWGLVEAGPSLFRVVLEAPEVVQSKDARDDERALLLAYLRKLGGRR